MNTLSHNVNLIFDVPKTIPLVPDMLTWVTVLVVALFIFILVSLRLSLFYFSPYEDRHKALDQEMTGIKSLKVVDDLVIRKIEDLSYSLHPKSEHISLKFPLIKICLLGIFIIFLINKTFINHHSLTVVNKDYAVLESYVLPNKKLYSSDIKDIKGTYLDNVCKVQVFHKNGDVDKFNFHIPNNKCVLLMENNYK